MRRSNIIAAAAGVLVLLGVGAGALVLTRGARTAEQASDTPSAPPSSASATPSPSPSPTASPSPSVSPSVSRSPSASPSPSRSARPSQSKRTTSYTVAWTGPAQPSATCGTSGARVVSFRIEVDRGLQTTPEQFTKDVLSILCDKRSWIASGHVRFRYDPKGSLLIGLRTQENKNRLCYPYTGYGSCQISGQVVINANRWFGGSKYVPLTLSDYRRMVINHEMGHVLGQSHRVCPKEGAPAPVMMQQTLGVTTDGRTCRGNPWPLDYELRTLS